jgi:uncharacterized heparinase superfamily protein
VNWVKWVLAGNTLPAKAIESLAIQTRFLAKRIEFHLLGNHLLANAKALIFSGFFFEGQEADAWIVKGLRILNRQLPEQILDDGGHFERSPMYHSIILEDLLDLINLRHCYSDKSTARGEAAKHNNCSASLRKGEFFGKLPLIESARRMIAWLRVMCHPDGQIALFNDAAFGIAPQPNALYEYAERLEIHKPDRAFLEEQQLQENSSIECLPFGNIKLTHLKSSGYIRVEYGPVAAILDVAPIGPDYLPGHAHADTLSFELSLHGKRVIIDSGTSCYDEGDERLQQRGTSAHNTVTIDGKDSSEVWGSFRVARRANPFRLELRGTTGRGIMVRCAHDGYRRLSGKPIHWREWHFNNDSLIVTDIIRGKYLEAVSRFHFHPALSIKKRNDALFSVVLPSGKRLLLKIVKGHGRLVPSIYHPEFGLNCPNQCLEVQLKDNAQIEIKCL